MGDSEDDSLSDLSGSDYSSVGDCLHREELANLRKKFEKYVVSTTIDSSDARFIKLSASSGLWNQVDFENKFGLEATLVDGRKIGIQGVGMNENGVVNYIVVNGVLYEHPSDVQHPLCPKCGTECD